MSNVNKVRVAIQHPKYPDRTRPTYGYPQPDGSLLEDGTNQVHPPGTWFRSRQSGNDPELDENLDE